MKNVQLNIIPLFKNVILPQKQTQDAVGYDIHAYINEEIILKPLDRIKVPTGFILDIPKNYFVSIRPRSGLAIKYGITMINTPGTIDTDYKGEIFILMVNLGTKNFTLKPQDRIAQMILEQENKLTFNIINKENISSSLRKDSGFGSTGR